MSVHRTYSGQDAAILLSSLLWLNGSTLTQEWALDHKLCLFQEALGKVLRSLDETPHGLEYRSPFPLHMKRTVPKSGVTQ